MFIRRFLVIALLGVTPPAPAVSAETGPAKESAPRGTLIAVGGGALPDRILDRFIDLAGGPSAPMLVIPQASDKPDAGSRGKDLFEKRGLKKVTVLDLTDRDLALKSIAEADGIWISGGSQGLLMERLRKVTGVVKAIRNRFRSGAVIAGTSAGAAAMSDVMIAGDDIPLDRGLGLWPEVIVDQHFVVRKRMQRSFDTVLANPKLLGIGIAESTAVIVSGGTFEVIGDGPVTIIDARKAERTEAKQESPKNWRGIRIDSLHEGETWQLGLQ